MTQYALVVITGVGAPFVATVTRPLRRYKRRYKQRVLLSTLRVYKHHLSFHIYIFPSVFTSSLPSSHLHLKFANHRRLPQNKSYTH